jgi:HAMP domain-containing protein
VSEQYIVWALVVGVVVGAALYWFALGRLPRETDDIKPAERVAEAGWISRTIEQRGGVAPVDLVEEVLDLHSAYLSGPALEVRDDEPEAEVIADDRAAPEPASAAASPTTTPADNARAKPTTRPEDAPQGS